MNYTKQQVINAVLSFAKKFDKEKSYVAIIESGMELPRLIEMIVYEMFIQGFNSYFASDEDFNNHKIILDYAKELKQNGFVNFKK